MEQNHMPVRPRPSQPDDQQRPHHADSKNLLHAQNAFPADGASRSAQQPEPPSSQPSHEPIAATSFAETPTTELPPIQPHHERTSSASNHSLPSLSSVTSGFQPKPESRPAPTQWPSLNPYTVFYSPGYAKPAETSRPVADRSAASPEQYFDRRSGSVSLDDPDVRMAAEALGDLRADFVSSSPNRRTPLPTPPRDQRMATSTPPNALTDRPQPEPLLSLITASHPLLATTIEGATSAYNQGKNYSPHLKTGAEYVEGYLTPVAKTINNIGQRTGVHTSVRWFLGSRRQGRKHQSTTDLETGERGIHKRRKARANEASDAENRPLGLRTPELPSYISDRRTSVSTVDTFDTLPAYDDARSPAYAEVAGSGAPQPELEWKTKIVVSTSSLGVALRDNNLRSLRYCLEGLRSANAYLSNRLASLQAAIEEYDATKEARDGDDDVMADASANRDGLVVRINALKNDIVMRISTAIKLVSDYAGGALPDNAKHLIHQQLLSLPGRLLHLSREASSGPPSGNAQDASMREGANRVTLLAKEGLQVITQVSDVIDRTIKSAEEWLETLGRGSGVQAGSLPDRTREKAPATAQWATTQSQFAAPLPDENHQMTDRV